MTSNTGVHPKLPLKKVPGTGLNTNGEFDYQMVMSEKDKRENNFEKIKRLVYHYEWIGRQQMNRVGNSISKKLNLAHGQIDVSDYVKDQTEYNVEISMLGGESLDYDLKFYPIIPNIVNSLVSELSKQYINYQALAVNREAINQVLDQKNQILRQILIQPLQAQFEAQMDAQGIEQGTDVYQQQLELFQQLPQVQKYFSKEYRLEVEQWANHQLQIDERRFNMKDIEKQSMFNKLSTDLPYVHVNLLEGDYKPEVIDPRHAYYLRSPYTDDVSEGVMFGWFEYESPYNLITRFGDKLTPENIEKIESLHVYYRTLLTNDTQARYNMDTPGILEAAQNMLAFREIGAGPVKDQRYRGEEFKERLVQISNMYLQVPRKVGKVTLKAPDQAPVSRLVDDTYKITYSPQYDLSYTKEKSETNLIEGEHLEWFYINELWRCVKINLSVNPNPDNSNDIWLVLEKYPIQLADLGRKFGSYIPVHGGPKTNRYNDIISIVDKCKPWQVFYNYLWNRNDQKIKGEIGKFFAMNQNVIPQESMGEEWGTHNFLKWALTARDTGVAPTDTSLTNTNQSNLSVTGGYGQVVDMTVTQEILEKAKLAEICKNECLQIVGISPQFLGDISPSETATGVTQGVNRSISQLKYLYDEHFTMFRKVRQTMLECAKFVALQNNSVEQTYVNDEGERVIFQIPTDLMIHQMGVYVTNSMDDNIIMENIKQYVLADNTIGADVLDKVALVSSKSIGEIYTKLKEVNQDKERKEKELLSRQEAQQQEILQSQERQLQAQLAEQARQKELDRQHETDITEIKVIGQSQFSEGGGFEELMKLKEAQDKQRNYYYDLVNQSTQQGLAREQAQNQNSLSQKEQDAKFDLERQKIQLGREKILADLKKSQNDVIIAKVNKNPKGSK